MRGFEIKGRRATAILSFLIALTVFTLVLWNTRGRSGKKGSERESVTVTAAATLEWTLSNSSNITNQRMYYGTSPGNYAQNIDVGPTTTMFTVGNLSPATTYYFAVSATNSSGIESPVSNEVAYATGGTPPPASPSPTATATVPPSPTPPSGITISPPVIQFTCVHSASNSTNPPPINVFITTSNGQPWGTQDTSPWCDAAPTNGVSGTSTILTPTFMSGLPAGSYAQNLTITAGSLNRVVVMNLTVTAGGATPTATATSTSTPRATATATVAPIPTATSTATFGATATATTTATPTMTASATATVSATVAPTATASATGTATATVAPTPTVTATIAPSPTATSTPVSATPSPSPDFSLTFIPPSRTVPSTGGTAKFTFTIIRSGGFTSPVTMTVEGLPEGVESKFDTAASSTKRTLNLSISEWATPGTYQLLVTGQSSMSLSHTASPILIIQ